MLFLTCYPLFLTCYRCRCGDLMVWLENSTRFLSVDNPSQLYLPSNINHLHPIKQPHTSSHMTLGHMTRCWSQVPITSTNTLHSGCTRINSTLITGINHQPSPIPRKDLWSEVFTCQMRLSSSRRPELDRSLWLKFVCIIVTAVCTALRCSNLQCLSMWNTFVLTLGECFSAVRVL